MNTNVFYGGGGGQQRIWKFNTIGVAGNGHRHRRQQRRERDRRRERQHGAARRRQPVQPAQHPRLHDRRLASGKVSDALIARGSAPTRSR